MKAAKLLQTTILMAFSLALAGVASEAGASAKAAGRRAKESIVPGKSNNR